jgi:predicted hydrocarbon binding protein
MNMGPTIVTHDAPADGPAPPPPGRHNYYADDFFRPDPAAGAVHDAYGRRAVRAAADFLAGLHDALGREVGDAAGEILYKLGLRWGAADMRALAARAPREFGVDALGQLNFNVLLETWRWPLTAAGWGTWRYDLRRARQGLPVVELFHSAAAAALGPSARPVCHLYAGLFAAGFGHLAGRELAGVELRCAAVGADRCRFLVATAARAAAAARLRDDGVSTDDLLERLGGPLPAPEGNGR